MENNREYSLIRIKKVLNQTGFARSTLYKLLKTNNFPQPIKISDRAIAWPQKAIDDWVASRISKSDV
jgi:prophage regulatory protein